MTYSISDLEQLSGVQSHTIRIWEQRYNALRPKRSEGNTRLYDDEQLVRLLNITSLNRAGLKISKICSLSNEDFEDLLNKHLCHSSTNQASEYFILQLIKYGFAFDEFNFNTLINECVDCYGLLDCYRRAIYPLLVRLGLMWRKNDICPSYEHFISNIIHQKIFSSINSIPLEKSLGQAWLLFLPEDEDHDIGLLFANYLLRIYKQKVIFLGSRVPLKSVSKVLSKISIDHVLLFMVKSRLNSSAQKYIDQLSEICSSTKIHLAGNSQIIGKLQNVGHINWFKTLDEFEKNIQKP